MTLETLKELRPYIQIGNICRKLNIDYAAFRMRLSRGKPELSDIESRQFERAINKLIIKKVGK